jgi:hypothetical protein
MLALEAQALLTRLARLRPYSLHMTMVPAAAISPPALAAIENHMEGARRKLRRMVGEFLRWLQGPGRNAKPEDQQRRFMLLRLRFLSVISQFDIFADVISQRSEHETGVWIAGLDDAATEALALPGVYKAPPVICYLERGGGAAIRRARTRLPGGEENPVAVIRVPRERMIGSSIASSLVHEVGHQGAALLDLVNSLRPALQMQQRNGGGQTTAWRLWERWISEIVADLWSVAKVGIAAPLGLIGVVSLPRAFVFRIDTDDPHPAPWIRVKLSCAMGNALYPHPQWARLAALWESFYPRGDLPREKRLLLSALEATMPNFISLLVTHRPRALGGRSLKEALASDERQPARLSALFQQWRASPESMRAAPPTLVFAVIGQAKFDGQVTPTIESRTLAELLTHWAVHSAFDTSAGCPLQLRQRSTHTALNRPSPHGLMA